LSGLEKLTSSISFLNGVLQQEVFFKLWEVSNFSNLLKPTPSKREVPRENYMQKQSMYLSDVCFGLQAPASCQRAENLYLGILPLGEALVLAALPSRADHGVALIEQHAIDAFGVQATWVFICWFAVATWYLRQVCSEDLHLPHRPVHLECTQRTLAPKNNRLSDSHFYTQPLPTSRQAAA